MSEADSRRATRLYYQTHKPYSDEKIARASRCCASVMVGSNDYHAHTVEGTDEDKAVIIADADRRVARAEELFQRSVRSEVSQAIEQIKPMLDKNAEVEREIRAYQGETKKLAQALERVEKLEKELEHLKQEWLAAEEKKDGRLSRLYR